MFIVNIMIYSCYWDACIKLRRTTVTNKNHQNLTDGLKVIRKYDMTTHYLL